MQLNPIFPIYLIQLLQSVDLYTRRNRLHEESDFTRCLKQPTPIHPRHGRISPKTGRAQTIKQQARINTVINRLTKET